MPVNYPEDAVKAEQLFDLTGEVALVTGASSGLGRQFSKTLAAHGVKVGIAARRTDRLARLKSDIEAAGGEAVAVTLDVADPGQVAPAFDQLESAFGTATLVVNNAGLAIQKMALDMTREDWRRIMDVNLDGVWHVAQEGARRMAEAGRQGSIINIASLLALRVAKTLSAYAVSKAAVKQLTEALALEFARHGIRVNAIAPGYVLTEINREFFDTVQGRELIKSIPQRRIAEPEELDGTLLLLASKASGFMTGSTIIIDGGQALTPG